MCQCGKKVNVWRLMRKVQEDLRVLLSTSLLSSLGLEENFVWISRCHWKLVLFSFNSDLLTSGFFWICRALLNNETLTRSVVSTHVLLPLSRLAPVGNNFDFVFLPFLWLDLMSFTTQPNSVQQGMRLGMRCCSMRITCPVHRICALMSIHSGRFRSVQNFKFGDASNVVRSVEQRGIPFNILLLLNLS